MRESGGPLISLSACINYLFSSGVNTVDSFWGPTYIQLFLTFTFIKPSTMSNRKFHGVEPRGLESTPRSTSFEGRFGRMFRTLPSARHSEADLIELGKAMVAEPENPPSPETEIDAEE